MNPKVATPDTRSPERRQFDEAAADGNWEGFETEELLTEEGALQLLAAGRRVNGAASDLRGQPFRWRSLVFRILRCDYHNGEAEVEVAPHHEEFAAEVKRRVEADRFHHLGYYQGFGFACFPEDYQQYSA